MLIIEFIMQPVTCTNVKYSQVILQTTDDAIPEERREFTFLVTSATGAASVSPNKSQATIVYAASDSPFGLFGFDSDAAVSVSEV